MYFPYPTQLLQAYCITSLYLPSPQSNFQNWHDHQGTTNPTNSALLIFSVNTINYTVTVRKYFVLLRCRKRAILFTDVFCAKLHVALHLIFDSTDVTNQPLRLNTYNSEFRQTRHGIPAHSELNVTGQRIRTRQQSKTRIISHKFNVAGTYTMLRELLFHLLFMVR